VVGSANSNSTNRPIIQRMALSCRNLKAKMLPTIGRLYQ
jgi:hypothetical protein